MEQRIVNQQIDKGNIGMDKTELEWEVEGARGPCGLEKACQPCCPQRIEYCMAFKIQDSSYEPLWEAHKRLYQNKIKKIKLQLVRGIQVLRNTMGGGWCTDQLRLALQRCMSNEGVGGCQICRKKCYVTLEWPLNGIANHQRQHLNLTYSWVSNCRRHRMVSWSWAIASWSWRFNASASNIWSNAIDSLSFPWRPSGRWGVTPCIIGTIWGSSVLKTRRNFFLASINARQVSRFDGS